MSMDNPAQNPTVLDFFFYTEIGKYTGISATSLKDFKKKLGEVPLESIEFHYQRGDFQRWVRDVFRDQVLAERIDRIGTSRQGEYLRTALQTVVGRSLKQLRFR